MFNRECKFKAEGWVQNMLVIWKVYDDGILEKIILRAPN